LRDTIAWSYDLLDEAERALFRRLSVFVGGFNLEAVEGICSGGREHAAPVLDQIASLVDKSLLRQIEDVTDDRRFGMLETIREYARERLRGHGEEDEVCRQHAEYYLALAEQAGPRLFTNDAANSIRRLTVEHDNF